MRLTLFKVHIPAVVQEQLAPWWDQFQTHLDERLAKPHGDIDRWLACVDDLPEFDNVHMELRDGLRITGNSSKTRVLLEQALRGLHPWRKGPFHVNAVHVNTEWRSDWKWNRIAPHLHDMTDHAVLDIGCGNGYHLWHMAQAGAKFALGVDPQWLFNVQFNAIRKVSQTQQPVAMLPLGVQHLPANMACFDTVFSMGVLYHRKQPEEHIKVLFDLIKPGGYLVLETLVIEGEDDKLLDLRGQRYAKMNNCYMLPTPNLAARWVEEEGFDEVRVVDVNITTTEEQRNTSWMQWESLPDFLDPDDSRKTIEGHPSPVRAVILARKPT